ncbi:AAA family ATPase [Vibrio agarivorans]|uniref:AAA family ATPase n=1 Tax=Vibrio agarivorans TaxID=153622 RepID=A0ABT7Y7E7_9VIBR|nr:AAA family ATPase [Vibrio agarivorans]MDN2483954.1 AAA family ATPase [Vibrio agarivorans]
MFYNEVKVGWDQVFGEVKVSPKAPKLTKKVWSSNVKSPYVPDVKPNYVFRFTTGIRKLVSYLETGAGQKPWIFGPHGSGKTSLPNQLAALLGMEIRSEYVSENTEALDLLGQWMPNEAGGLKYEEGLVVQAMRTGQWVIINEFDLMEAREQKRLNELFEENSVTLPSGERVKAASGFRLMVTANTNGTGDMTGNYSNVSAGDSSVGDRFFFVELDYISRDEEKTLLTKQSDLILQGYCNDAADYKKYLGIVDKFINEPILNFASDTRLSHNKARMGDDSGLPAAISTRSVLEWQRQAVDDLFWIDSSNELIKEVENCMISSLEHSFIMGQRPDLQQTLIQMFNDRSGGIYKLF